MTEVTKAKNNFRVFYKDPDLPMLLKMFFPIFVDMLLNNFISTIHSYFVSSAGEAVISAISLVNQVNNLVSTVFFSACSATMVVVAQLRGSGNEKRASLVVGQTVAFSVYGTILIAFAFYFFPVRIMNIFFGKTDPSVLFESVKYIKLLGISLPMYAVFQTCACSCRGYDNHKIPLCISVTGSLINVICAFVFIKVLDYGIVGAALSLIICRTYMAVLSFLILYRRSWIAPIHKCLKIRFSVIKNILYLGFFSSSESIITSLAGTLKTSFLVPFGVSHIAASSVFSSFTGLLNVPISVMGTLTVTLVAKNIGSGNYKNAKSILLKCLIYSFSMSAVVWTGAYFILPHIFPLYTQNPVTLDLLRYILIINVIGNPTFILFVTIIRQGFNGAGDAKFSTISSVISMLIFNLGGGYVLTVILNLGVIGSILSGFLSSIVKTFIYVVRYKSGKWEKKVMV